MEKLQRLKTIIADTGPCVVAFSGGVDSVFLAKVARDTLGKNVLAATIATFFFPASEQRDARRLASRIGIRHIVLNAGLPGIITANPIDRCYYCKKHLFGSLLGLARQKGFKAVVEASNADDDKDYRPGMKAIKEMGVGSPLREAGLTKGEIRLLSRRMGLESWNRPSSACLASRFPYGEKVTRKKLAMVEKAEEYLRGIGIRQVRVRCHGGLARIETEPGTLRLLAKYREDIAAKLRGLGFTYVTIDIEGYRIGSMNEAIRWKNRKS
jgi:pyridinium-3,5-biscarboxylic acid mononucleotide sulfurtransferase